MRKGQSIGWGLAAAGIAAWVAYRLYRSWNAFNYRNKTVLITGGSRGLGLILARQLVELGAKVAICARDARELDRAFEDLSRRGGHVLTIPCDLTVEANVAEMVSVVERRLGPIDVLINNAGIMVVGPIGSMELDDFERSMQANFFSALYAVMAVLPSMRARQSGRIVNIASIGGKLSLPHLLPYSASKFALVGLSEGLRSEVAQDGIMVTTVCPGLMRTGSPRQATVKGRVRDEYAWFSASDAMPGLSMSAERAARQILTAAGRGDAEVVLSLPAKIASLIHGLAPGLTARLLELTNRALPAENGSGKQGVKGKWLESETPTWLAARNQQAAHDNNEIDPREE
jgi:short-subunit dehydrogenase